MCGLGIAALGREGEMPIRGFLDGQAFEPEVISNMSTALEGVCAELGLALKDDSATRLVASTIIKLAQRGISDPALSRSETLKAFKAD